MHNFFFQYVFTFESNWRITFGLKLCADELWGFYSNADYFWPLSGSTLKCENRFIIKMYRFQRKVDIQTLDVFWFWFEYRLRTICVQTMRIVQINWIYQTLIFLFYQFICKFIRLVFITCFFGNVYFKGILTILFLSLHSIIEIIRLICKRLTLF